MKTIQHPTFKDLPTYMPKNQCYDVDMPRSLTMREHSLEENTIGNLNVGSLEGSLKET